MAVMNRFGNMEAFAGGEFDQDRQVVGAMGTDGTGKKVTVNLEDAVLEEQKLFQILEVS